MQMAGEATILNKATTVVVLAAVLAVAVGLAIAPYVSFLGLVEETETTQQLVDALGRQVENQKKLSAAATGRDVIRPEDIFVTGETVGIAGAGLQSRLVELVSRNGGHVKALLVVPPPAGSKADVISVNVVANMPMTGLQAILYEIETSTPLLFVDNLAISVGEGREAKALTGPLHVDVTMLVTGYRSAGPQS